MRERKTIKIILKIKFTDACIKICKIKFRDTSDFYRSKMNKIHFGYPQSNIFKIRFGQPTVLISPNSHHTNSHPN